MGTPTRYTNGIGTASASQTLGQFGMPDPTKWHVFFDVFDDYAAADWIITTTEAGAGSATEATSSADGGALVITNDAADNDADFFQWSGTDSSTAIETFKFVAGKKLFFKARFKVSDATQSDFVIGLQITDTTPLDVTDGVFFQKDDGDASLDFHVEKDNSATDATAIATVSDDTYMVVGFYYNGADKIHYFVDESEKGYTAVTNLPDDEELTVSFGIQNGEAVAKIMTIDYIFVAKER
jgi:hypothetical protein